MFREFAEGEYWDEDGEWSEWYLAGESPVVVPYDPGYVYSYVVLPQNEKH